MRVHPLDIVILVPNHEEGLQLVESFEKRHIHVNHVFEDDEEKKRNKRAFWMLDLQLKMSTIHSFKGWELINVILLTPELDTKKDGNLDYLMYVAMTRTRGNLIVFNRNENYVEFGKGCDPVWTP